MSGEAAIRQLDKDTRPKRVVDIMDPGYNELNYLSYETALQRAKPVQIVKDTPEKRGCLSFTRHRISKCDSIRWCGSP